MKTFVVGTGLFQESSSATNALAEMSEANALRKATKNMKMAYCVVQQAVQEASVALNAPYRGEYPAAVLGSSYGEIENTASFMESLALRGLARPFLFQSSLHNGTIGFLSVELGLKGASFTVDHRYFTGEKALGLGIDLIRGGIAPFVLVVALDTMSPLFMPVFAPNIPQGWKWTDGAAAVLLASEQALNELRCTPIAEVVAIEYEHDSVTERIGQADFFFDSDGLSHFVRSLHELAHIPFDPQTSNDRVSQRTKPDGSATVIRFKK